MIEKICDHMRAITTVKHPKRQVILQRLTSHSTKYLGAKITLGPAGEKALQDFLMMVPISAARSTASR
jgi:hypothetical protein